MKGTGHEGTGDRGLRHQEELGLALTVAAAKVKRACKFICAQPPVW